MRLAEAKKLKAYDMIYHVSRKNADGSAMRARVTSIKTWKRTPGRIEVRVKHGLYDYAVFTETELHQINAKDLKRAWTIEDLGSWVYEVKHLPTGRTWKLAAREFIHGQIHYNEIVEKFPNYIHNQLWEMQGHEIK